MSIQHTCDMFRQEAADQDRLRGVRTSASLTGAASGSVAKRENVPPTITPPKIASLSIKIKPLYIN